MDKSNEKWMKDSLDYTQQHFSNNISIQRKTYSVTGGLYKQEIIMKENQDEIKVGDLVELTSLGRHNSNIKEFSHGISFTSEEVGVLVTILDICIDKKGKLGYKVQCNKGITYLRRSAFRLITSCKLNENYDYLIPLIQNLNNNE